jgi:iron complex outermembrane receptor protein
MREPHLVTRHARISCLLAASSLFPLSVPAQTSLAAATALDTEVVVTARRIEENLQDVPVSVQALAGEYLDDADVTRLHELQFVIPGLVVNTTGMFGGGYALRGMGDQSVAGLAVAPHLNGVYLGDANVALARMFDVARIEVLKGPQGTLYGRNSTGGSLNVITRAPERTLDSEIEVAYGSFETTRAQGHVNLPLDDAALRVAFIASEGDGYIRNSVDSRRFAEADFWGIRGSMRIEPTETLRLDIVAQHIRDDGGTGDLWTPNPASLHDPKDIRLTTVTLENPYLISEIDNLNVTFDYDLGFASLRSITGYASSTVRNVDDCAGMPFLAGCIRSALPNDFDQWSQELQLVFPRSGSLEGVVGAYYADDDGAAAFYQFLPTMDLLPRNDNYSTSSGSSSALFGQATLHFSQRWSATAGLRLSREERRDTAIGTGSDDSQTLLAGTTETEEPSWLLNLAYAPNDDAMLYASISTGYTSGGLATLAPVDGQPDAYGPEFVTAYEAGAKSQWLGGRLTLNAAAFFYDYEDLQVQSLDSDTGQFGYDNAAKAQVYGIDAETSFAASERWSFSGGLVWVPKREFVEYLTEDEDFSGNTLVRAPEWSAVGAIGYGQPLGELGNLWARLEYSYRSEHFYTADNFPLFWQDAVGLLNAFVKFESASGGWYAFASGRNLTNEDYFTQVFLQSSPGYPDTYEIGFGFRF